jgi:2-keto-4-pentenoate hydratase
MPGTATAMETLADSVQHAQDQALPLPLFSSSQPGFSLADAYTVAAQLQQRRVQGGARVVGRKIGFTNPQLWDQYGVRAPIWGAMYAHTVTPAANLPAGFSLRPFVQPKIEPELVLHLHRTPPPGADEATLLACIDWVAHGFEIVQSHYADWKFTAADAVADGSLHGALLLGEPVPLASIGADVSQRLRACELTLHCDGQPVQSGVGSNVLGSPLAALAHLVALLAAQGPQVALQAGEMVTTGTVTAAYAIASGQTWHTTVHGIDLPGLRVAFTA